MTVKLADVLPHEVTAYVKHFLYIYRYKIMWHRVLNIKSHPHFFKEHRAMCKGKPVYCPVSSDNDVGNMYIFFEHRNLQYCCKLFLNRRAPK